MRVVCGDVPSDGYSHSVIVYMDVTAQACTNSDLVFVNWTRGATANTTWMSLFSTNQETLFQAADADRISYGYLYLAAQNGTKVRRNAGHGVVSIPPLYTVVVCTCARVSHVTGLAHGDTRGRHLARHVCHDRLLALVRLH